MTNSLERLTDNLKKLPGIGPKSAARLAYFILTMPKSYSYELSSSLTDVAENVKNCSICFNYTEDDICDICSDPGRDESVLCIVEHPKNIRVIENTGFKGKYHITGGVISPMEGIGPEQIRIIELMERLKNNQPEEIIFALNPRIEADTTIDYIRTLISERYPEIRLSRPASGIPVGSDIEFADSMTLYQAFSNRLKLMED